MNLLFTEEAEHDLDLIWDWTARRFGIGQADKYRANLINKTRAISEDYENLTRQVPGDDKRYALLKSKNSRNAHGHIAVFEKQEEHLVVLHYFHTASDWKPD